MPYHVLDSVNTEHHLLLL